MCPFLLDHISELRELCIALFLSLFLLSYAVRGNTLTNELETEC